MVLKMWASEASQQLEELARQDNIESQRPGYPANLPGRAGAVSGRCGDRVCPLRATAFAFQTESAEAGAGAGRGIPGDLIAAIHQAGYR